MQVTVGRFWLLNYIFKKYVNLQVKCLTIFTLCHYPQNKDVGIKYFLEKCSILTL